MSTFQNVTSVEAERTEDAESLTRLKGAKLLVVLEQSWETFLIIFLFQIFKISSLKYLSKNSLHFSSQSFSDKLIIFREKR